jgi:hypothetical protein
MDLNHIDYINNIHNISCNYTLFVNNKDYLITKNFKIREKEINKLINFVFKIKIDNNYVKMKDYYFSIFEMNAINVYSDSSKYKKSEIILKSIKLHGNGYYLY